jgi:hypothetical protein
VEDPFDKVLLLKNIDNAILTSFRTMKEENNMISETMKVVHNKFSAATSSTNNREKLKKTYRHGQTQLY